MRGIYAIPNKNSSKRDLQWIIPRCKEFTQAIIDITYGEIKSLHIINDVQFSYSQLFLQNRFKLIYVQLKSWFCRWLQLFPSFSLSTSRRICTQQRRRIHCCIYMKEWSDKRNMNMRNDIEEMIYFLLWISFALLLWMCTLQCTTFLLLHIFKFIFIAACRHLNMCVVTLLKHTKKKQQQQQREVIIWAMMMACMVVSLSLL